MISKSRDSVFLEELSSSVIKARIEAGARSVIVPMAAVEQHGPHLPIFTDTWLGYVLCGPIARLVGNMLVAPPVRPGRSDHHMAMPGTITVTDETFRACVQDYCTSLAAQGFTRIFWVVTHGGNNGSLTTALPTVQSQLPNVEIIFISGSDLRAISQGVNRALNLDQKKCGSHAGLTEGSMVLATRPELVHMDEAREGWMGDSGPEFSAELNRRGIKAFSEWGILGDPRESTPELGVKILNGRAQAYAVLIREKLGVPRIEDAPDAGYTDEFLVDALPHRADRTEHLLMEEMTWKEIGEALAEGWTTIILPVGGLSDHGPFLPTGTDTMLGYELGARLARAMGKALVAPVMRPASGSEAVSSPGTVVYRSETFAGVLREHCRSLAKHGFERILLFSVQRDDSTYPGDLLPSLDEDATNLQIDLVDADTWEILHARALASAGIDLTAAQQKGAALEIALMRTHRPELVSAPDDADAISETRAQAYWSALVAEYCQQFGG